MKNKNQLYTLQYNQDKTVKVEYELFEKGMHCFLLVKKTSDGLSFEEIHDNLHKLKFPSGIKACLGIAIKKKRFNEQIYFNREYRSEKGEVYL